MTQLVPRKAIGTSRRPTAAIFAIVIIVAAAAGFTFGYDLWRFLVSAFLVVTLAAAVALIALLLPSILGGEQEPTAPALTITHSATEGTLIEGTYKGDGTAEILKRSGWRYSRNVGWFVPQSRDRLPKTRIIGATVSALEEAGFTVTTEIDQSLRPTDEVEADRVARQAQRVEGLTEKAGRKATAADAAEAKADSLAKMLPLGQPILVGHHSEGKMRRHFDRITSTTRASITATEEARESAERAAIAARTTDLRYAPRTVARRIERLEVEQRKFGRAIASYTELSEISEGQQAHLERLEVKNAELLDQITYWKGIRAEQISSGQAVEHSRDTIAKGDLVKYMGEWHAVKRVNQKSVTVDWGTWSPTVPYADVEGHKPAPATS
jgi:hypothetical protein